MVETRPLPDPASLRYAGSTLPQGEGNHLALTLFYVRHVKVFAFGPSNSCVLFN
jgi:hypothetical protein